MSIKFNNADAIYGGFENVTPPARRNRNSDNDAAIGAAMIIGGLLGAAAVAAAADDDYYTRRAAEIRREAEREAARREAEREAERRADEIRREAERAARRAAYGLSKDEVTKQIVKFCMDEPLCTSKMVVMTALVRELLESQGATINTAENSFGDLKIKGRCADGTDLRIKLSSIGGITVDAYDGRLNRYSSSNKVFKEYELLVKEYNKDKFDKLSRVMSY
jgi:hypothetical protein